MGACQEILRDFFSYHVAEIHVSTENVMPHCASQLNPCFVQQMQQLQFSQKKH